MKAAMPCEPCHGGLRRSFLWGREPFEGCAEMEAAEPCHWGLRRSSLRSHEPCEGCAEVEAAVPCEPCHGGLRRSSLWSHETCEWCAETEAAVPCEPCHWGLRRSSLWGHETCEGCAEIGWACGEHKQGWEEGGRGGRSKRRERGALSLQNDDPTFRMVGNVTTHIHNNSGIKTNLIA